ncbi:hypothetical protein IP98_02797 [Flavobacterium cauense R2A-7]|uniref:MAE-28990/MAE-18760-like HEPN domain-containing protein n=1 Tax=Flavobacterium cauense R2A-7 TaxID=1341154 RepID=A0A562LL82_9FLAO|nr:MAE_28990/MAE_18760 family HEPN-like nuclease [Flavobacterium cauense]KGO79628.1 hypothetical protein Q762_14120 [Flavobacterium cauense R2A-7]TWI08377.1 hypothetical protein IP98_02797 [Flavobacterium cauense R2A-7]
MNTIKNEFDEKYAHINLYFDMLDKLINKAAKLQDNTGDIHEVNHDLIKVLKANVFLLLYNLLESTVRKSTEHIHISLSTDTLQYKDFQKEVQKIWIEFKYNNLKDQGSSQILDVFENISTDLINVGYDDYINKRKANDMSGNVDAKSVRELSTKYGFSNNSRVKGGSLVIIKNRRNNLAHGNITFAECGKDYTYSELIKFKKEVYLFLKEFLNNVEKFTSIKSYKK